MATRTPTVPSVASVLARKLVFVSGKGGVGKTAVSQAIARQHAAKGRTTLWVAFEDPLRPPGEIRKAAPRLWHLNCDAEVAFEEYSTLKLGAGPLSRLFIGNKLVRYLAKAAPGIHELVLLGKVWNEREHYERVVVDMPSTGHGLAMFQSTKNFSELFTGGPVHRDAGAMIETFADPKETGHLIVALPEEMPLRESLELNEFLLELFPENPAAFLANRLFPQVITKASELERDPPQAWATPLASSAEDYCRKRSMLEVLNLRIWKDLNLPYAELDYEPPSEAASGGAEFQRLVERLAAQLEARGYP